MSKLNRWKTSYAAFLLCAAAAIASPAQTFTTIHSFDIKDGNGPSAGLVQATDGNLYGTTAYGGASSEGTVFRISPNGVLTSLQSFDGTDGEGPDAGLVQGTDGNFYGTTVYQGANISDCGGFGCGTVFKITSSGTMSALYSFCSESGCTDGSSPMAGLLLATDGNFYGTTFGGGANGDGTVFKITPSGALTTLHNFCSQSDCADGASPEATLMQASDGNLYGTTYYGGTNAYGTMFKISPSGTLTTLYSFCSQSGCTDGENPQAALIQARDRNFYGTTANGGANHSGTIFKIISSGVLTTLYSFCSQSGCTDGASPTAGLVQATDGNFYGTTRFGGAYGGGTVFRISPAGTLSALHSFCSLDGCNGPAVGGVFPYAALVQDTNGTFYGTTYLGGDGNCLYGCGTVFSLSVSLGPFVKTQPTSGKVGATVEILGTSLTGATSVTFNGTAAAFTVEASSVIKATVPEGAITGTAQVVTPSGTLSSNVPFRVAP